MKKLLLGLIAFAILPATVFGGSEHIIKQRARELSNQNNVRQGVRPAVPAQNAPAGPVAAAPAPVLTPQQQALSRLQASLSAIRPESPATAQKTELLARELLAVAFASPKPSAQTVNKLAAALSAALTEKLLSNPTRNRLVQDLNAVLNPAKIPQSQMQDVIADIQAVFQSSGVDRKEAAKVSAAANAVLAETRPTAAK
jgi:hypothetical protein